MNFTTWPIKKNCYTERKKKNVLLMPMIEIENPKDFYFS